MCLLTYFLLTSILMDLLVVRTFFFRKKTFSRKTQLFLKDHKLFLYAHCTINQLTESFGTKGKKVLLSDFGFILSKTIFFFLI